MNDNDDDDTKKTGITKRKIRKDAHIDDNDKDKDKDSTTIDKNNEEDHLLPKGDDDTWRDIDGKGSSVDEIFDDADFGVFQLRMLFLIGGAIACDAMEITLLAFIQGCVMLEWGISTTYESILTSSVFVGQVIGMLVFGPLGDKFGRRPIILFGWFFIVIFGLVSCISPDIWFLIITRTLVGIGIGASQAISYDLFAETVPTKYRSRIIYVSLFSILGGLYVIAVAWAILETWGWRWVAFFCALPIAIVAIFGYFFMYESPRWLTTQKRYEEAEEIMNIVVKVNKCSKYEEDPVVIKRDDIAIEEGSLDDLFSLKYRFVTSLVWSSWLFGYFTFYSIFLVLILNFEDENSCSYEYEYIFLAQSVEIIGVLFAFYLIDVIGRSLTLSALFGYTCFGALSFALLNDAGYETGATVMLISNKISVAGAIATLWILTSEIYPTFLRGTGHSAACILGRVGAFAAVFWVDDFAYANVLYGSILYIITSALVSLCGLFLPETMYKKLDD